MRMRLLLLTLLPFSLFGQTPTVSELPDQDQGYQHIERFIKILEEVRTNHPDADHLSYERLINHALEGMVGSLDSFSGFYHPETVQHLDFEGEAIEEQFAIPSLGLSLAQKDGTVYIFQVREHSAAERAGLRSKDILRKKDDTPLFELDLPEVHALLQGSPGQRLALTIYRNSARREIETELLHAVTKQEALPDAYFLEQSKIAYTRLTEFSATAARELEAALDDLEDQGLETLILDLRGNPGGLLTVAVEILGLFLPPETEVVSTQGRTEASQQPPLKTAAKQRVKREYPLVVLLDRNSASASELVGGALQDLKRATLIGETSFGKGSVQNISSRAGGTTLRLTIATYHTPSGNTPHKVGVTPDIEVPFSLTDLANFERFKVRKTASPETLEELEKWNDPAIVAARKHLTK